MENKSQNLVSVLINCRNSEKYIKECLDSVFNQSFKKFEVIIIDNQSKDSTKIIIDSYKDNRIKYFKTKKSLDLGAARNYGLTKAKGSYIAFIDSDDIWRPTKLEELLSLFDKDTGLVYSDVLYFNDKKSFTLYKSRTSYSGNCFEKLILDYNLCLSSCIVSRDVINSNNINFSKKLKINEAYDFFLRISLVSKLKFLNKTLVEYRIHGENFSSKYQDLFYIENEQVINDLNQEFNINSEVLKNALNNNELNKSCFLLEKKPNI